MDKLPTDNPKSPKKSLTKENSTFEEIFLDTDIKNIKSNVNDDSPNHTTNEDISNQNINLEKNKKSNRSPSSSNSSESLERISCSSEKFTEINKNDVNIEKPIDASKKQADKTNGTKYTSSSQIDENSDLSKSSEPKQCKTKETTKYGGIYVEISEYPETHNEDKKHNPALVRRASDTMNEINLDMENPIKTSDNLVDKSTKISGLLEGMDPETGNYIRTQNLNTLSPNDKKLESLDASQLTTTSSSGKSFKRGWSKRLVSTLSNRTRNPDDSDEDDGADNCIFGNQIRFTIMIISTLCLSSILSNILTFNFTFICMAGTRPENFSMMTEEEISESGYRPDLDYSSVKRSALFMAVAVGALLAVFPLTIMLNKFGSRMVFGVLGYISALSTYLIPVSANLGFPFILIMRVIQGAGFSACLPVMGSITSHWSTLKQNGIFIAILSSFLQIAPIFTMPISGELCTSELGWQSVYYLHGTVCVFLFTAFIFYHRNSPNKHPLMQRTELVKVMIGKGSIYSGPGRTRKSKKVPYDALYKDPAIWAILIAAFGNFMGTQLSLQFMPTYLNKVLFLPIEQTGVTSAISPVIMFFIKLLAGQSSDRITFISDEWKLRIYNTLSMGMMGTFFIVLALLNPYEQKSLCLCVLILSTCILGFNSGGFFKSSQMVSRQHSHFTLANISFLNCICMLIVPLLNELIAPENTPDRWAVVLWIHGIILISTNIFFCYFSSSKPAKWTLDSWTHRSEADKKAPLSRHSRRHREPSKIAPETADKPSNGFA